MSRETDELRGHEFDGIQEYDNPLPRWWLGLFYIAIVFGVVYAPWVQFGTGHLIADEYAAEMAEAKELYGDPSAEMVASFRSADLAVSCAEHDWKAGAKKDFVANCLACHRPDGGGLVGPNFTDDYYLHGGRLIDIARTITLGVPAKGMITWGKTLKRDQIVGLACYVQSLRGTQVVNGKEPQGVLVGPDGEALNAEKAAGTQEKDSVEVQPDAPPDAPATPNVSPQGAADSNP